MKVEQVTNLKRNATGIIRDLTDDPDPVLITQRGRPAAYLLNIAAFEQMESRIKILEGIARGETAIEDGRVIDHDEAKERMARWLS